MSKQKPTKFCTKCHREFSINGFYVKDKKSGRRFSWCKECHNAISKARYQPKPKTPYVLPKKKACTKCFRVKPIREFEPRGDDPTKRRSHCRDCKRAEGREYKAGNKSLVKKSNAEYRLNLGDILKIRHKNWREANPGRYREIHHHYKTNNRDTVNAATHRRRARIKGNGGSYTADEWQAIKAAQDYSCLMCGRPEPEIKLTVDHVIPVSEGGANTADNIQGLCKSCNSKKHRKVLDLRGS